MDGLIRHGADRAFEGVGELDQDRRPRRRAGGAGEREGGDETGEEAVTLHLRGGGCWSHRQTPPLPPSPGRATAPRAGSMVTPRDYFAAALVALALMQLKQAREPGPTNGHWLAVTGIVCSLASVVVAALFTYRWI